MQVIAYDQTRSIIRAMALINQQENVVWANRISQVNLPCLSLLEFSITLSQMNPEKALATDVSDTGD